MISSWCNGEPATQLPIDDRSVLFGDSCFSTIAVANGQPALWSRHRERLQLTVQRLRFPEPDWQALERELAAACSGVERGIVRITLTRGRGGRGYGLPANGECQRLLLCRDWPQDIEPRGRDGIRIRWCDTRLSTQPLLAGLKHGNRLEQVLARAEWQDAQIAEGLMCDDRGLVVEGTTSNLFFRAADGHWCTPSLPRCGVAGVMRAELLAQCEQQGLPVEVADFQPDALLAATEVFLCNAVIGIWPVIALAERQWPIGAATRQLQQLIGRNPNG